jgi:hypothetical protein
MSDSPSADGTTGGGVSMTSLFQSNLVGIKASLGVNWLNLFHNAGSPTQQANAVYMTVAF